jgi:hypothetical protein
MLKKILAAVGALALTLGLVALVAGPASAHNHTVTADCIPGVAIDLNNYQVTKTNATPNTVTVVVDGTTVVDNVAFGTTFQNTYPWTTTPAASHTYRVKVIAEDDLSGTNGWTFDTGVKTVAGCATSTDAGTVKHTDPYCSAAGVVGDGGYTIPDVKAATYTVTIGGVSTVKTAGTYSAAPGSVIHVVATPASTAYTLTGTTTWDFTIAALDKSTCIVPAVVTFTESVCTASTPGVPTAGTYTVPASANGVTYVLKGTTTPLDAKTYQVTTFPSSVDIVAIIPAGETLPANTPTEWTHTFSSAGDCVFDSKVVTPAFSAETCLTSAPGVPVPSSYTLTAATGLQYEVSLNGAKASVEIPGKYFLNPGDTVVVTAEALSGYKLVPGADGLTTWTYKYTTITGGCLVTTTAAAPTFTEQTCTVGQPGQSTSGSYTITKTADQHVTFTVSLNGGTAKPVLPGTYSVSPADVVVVAVLPETGYTISPAIDPALLTHTFAKTVDCTVHIDVVQPAPTSQSCVASGSGGSGSLGQLGGASSSDVLTDAFINIPNTTGVQYFINGVAYNFSTYAPTGNVVLQPGTYQVTAMAKTGYTLSSTYPATGWTEVLTSAEPCGQLITHPLVDPTATQVQLGCFTGGSYTLTNDLSDPAAITWTVNGSTVTTTSAPQTFTVNKSGTVKIHAVANGPTYGLETSAQTDWTFVFAQPSTCDLKTLALTGSSPTGWLTLGYLMLVSGLALLAARFVRRRAEQA